MTAHLSDERLNELRQRCNAEVWFGLSQEEACALVGEVERLRAGRPPIVALCGSTRFREEFAAANQHLTRQGVIVLAPGVFAHSGDPLTDEEKTRLDELHKRKIDLADEVLVVSDESGYYGDSTRSEIAYAEQQGKPVRYLVGGDHD
ncbi:DUF4406 domain-containing protein [Sphaerimonospora mesophila]|uniref:DUF4406 domain-containing protein n=1 Tax=Sphaerimonospora mesophila TaxID=37483 RepID=UPI000AEE55E3